MALTCTTLEIERRIGAESRTRHGKLTSVDLYRRLETEGAFQFPPLPAPLLSISTDTCTPEQAADTILAAVRNLTGHP